MPSGLWSSHPAPATICSTCLISSSFASFCLDDPVRYISSLSSSSLSFQPVYSWSNGLFSEISHNLVSYLLLSFICAESSSRASRLSYLKLKLLIRFFCAGEDICLLNACSQVSSALFRLCPVRHGLNSVNIVEQ